MSAFLPWYAVDDMGTTHAFAQIELLTFCGQPCEAWPTVGGSQPSCQKCLDVIAALAG